LLKPFVKTQLKVLIHRHNTLIFVFDMNFSLQIRYIISLINGGLLGFRRTGVVNIQVLLWWIDKLRVVRESHIQRFQRLLQLKL